MISLQPNANLQVRAPPQVATSRIATRHGRCVSAPGAAESALCRSGVAGGLTLAVLARRKQGRECDVRARRRVVRRGILFEHFTEKTIRAVTLAQEEAKRLGQTSVGTEMLVVGVVAEGSELGGRVLRHLGVDIGLARSELESLLDHRGEIDKNALHIPFTTASKRALEDTLECARSLGSSSVDTSHLLLSVLQQEEGNGSLLLRRLCKSSSPKVLKGELVRMLNAQQAKDRGDVEVQHGSVGGNTAITPSETAEEDLPVTLKYGKDLTLMARSAQLDPLVGRQEQLERTVRILGRRSKNNPVLVGEAGVGKTSIAYGLAQRIADGEVPDALRGRRVVQLDLAALLAGTRYRGDFEERVREVIREVSATSRSVILVIDEVHMLVGAGGTGNSEGGGVGMDAANLLKPALARGELQCVGATTLDEYRSHIERDPALERRFQPVQVPEPSEEEAVQILQGLVPMYEGHHAVRFSPEALRAAVGLSSQFISSRRLPDKAIDVVDEAGSKVRQAHDRAGSQAAAQGAAVSVLGQQDARSLAAEANALQQERFALRNSGARGREVEWLRAREVELREQLWKQEVRAGARAKEAAGGDQLEVTEADVAEVIATWSGIPVSRVSSQESERLLKLEGELHASVIGQDEAVQCVSRALRRARAGLRDPARPIAGLMFCGPTGVGKTALCKTLASSYFGSDKSMIRLDMSEFMEKHTVSKLIGAPPGYVGYSEGGTLTEAIRQRPYSLVLFDEVEKAHPDVFNTMLQLLDDGRLTDSRGRTVSFANSLVVMTSNVGSRQVERGVTGGGAMGFDAADDAEDARGSNYSRVQSLVMDELKGLFRPEFLNRLDEVVVFQALTRDNVRKIADVELPRVLNRLGDRGIKVNLTESFKRKVVSEGFDPAYGARPLRRAIAKLLEDPLAEHLLAMERDGQMPARSGESEEEESASPEAASQAPVKDTKTITVDVDGDGHVSVSDCEDAATVGVPSTR